MTEQEMMQEVEGMLTPERFRHSVGVKETAERLALQYGVDAEKARIAGILHDCAKNIPKLEAMEICNNEGVKLKDICRVEKGLMHAYLGAHMAKTRFGVEDEEILDAIYYHTTGAVDMKPLTKIIYLADMIEPGRKISGIEPLRMQAFKDIDDALIRAFDSTIRHVINKGGILDCDTINARNFLVIERKKAHK